MVWYYDKINLSGTVGNLGNDPHVKADITKAAK
jgi:hypothetical protein